MTVSPLILKNPKGWFAAGAEVEKALMLLSDGAFKLFVHLCLTARRDTAILESSQTDLSRNLKKSQGAIRNYLREMEAKGVCRMRFNRNPHGRGIVEIKEPFWPYQRAAEAAPNDAADSFVASVKKLLQERACVHAAFSVSDEILARDWYAREIPLERIEQAVLMGCTRKYVSWRNNQTRTAIGSLKYFESVLTELEGQVIDPEYWGYLRHRMERMEKLWKDSHEKSRNTSEPDAAAQSQHLAVGEIPSAQQAVS
jgi:hypothetical protein